MECERVVKRGFKSKWYFMLTTWVDKINGGPGDMSFTGKLAIRFKSGRGGASTDKKSDELVDAKTKLVDPTTELVDPTTELVDAKTELVDATTQLTDPTTELPDAPAEQ